MVPIVMIFFTAVLPIVGLIHMKINSASSPWIYSLLSFASCFVAMCQEVYKFGQRAIAGDTVGILDTWESVLVLCIGLAVYTLVLNFIVLRIGFKKVKRAET